MKGAIALLKTSRPTFYRWLREGKIKGMKVGRQWRFYREDIERFLAGQEPRVDAPGGIGNLIGALTERLEALGGKDSLRRDDGDVRHAINLTIVVALQMRASDIHVAPTLKAGAETPVAVIRYRVDGVLHPAAEFPIRLLPAIVEQWKRMAACDPMEKTRPQDGRIMVGVPERVDLRVSFVPAVFGDTLTVRVLSREGVSLDLDRIDYAAHDRQRLERSLALPWGIICVTGPTGSGKTTVMYCCLNRVAGPSRKGMTIEDPVEYALPWLTQIPVRPQAGVTFPVAMRSVLRSDPDVIMIGEIRDRESLHIAYQAALTGHLILTSLHTDSAASALKRMVDIGSPPFLVSDSVKLVLSQRLVRLLCPDCSRPCDPPAEHLGRAVDLARAGGIDWDTIPRTFREPTGCAKCGNTGYRGRTVIAETLVMTPEIAAALRRGASIEELQAVAVGQGMTTMAAAGIRRAADGATALSEVMRALGVGLA